MSHRAKTPRRMPAGHRRHAGRGAHRRGDAAAGVELAQATLRPDGWVLEHPETLALLAKLRQAGKPLREYLQGKLYFGIKTGLNEAYIVDEQTKQILIAAHPSSEEVLAPFLRGRDVKRWCVDNQGRYLIKLESSANKRHPWSGKDSKTAEAIFKQTYPAIHAHFAPHRAVLIKRLDEANTSGNCDSARTGTSSPSRRLSTRTLPREPSFHSMNKDSIWSTPCTSPRLMTHLCLACSIAS